ncbi:MULTISPECIES: D-ribose pyranase [Lonsdalea]|uniref:D-ribose pyranase n=2 Tax=Lonsdalea TaxID=1082702 RepID=A0ACD1JEJ4_9GAMM|nr:MULTISPECIES: D-ribose pyranase [Lonsdalea]OSM94395.1 D-ribose pyranase [Lonsdalea populi]OSN00763.1 D-ribose pyranase [Lonsdalea populi]QPQ25955.1 D-ribose pyranase [Lonsdalea populi]RAT15012.1 D-ribose pyranase [Lonsdalea quercina]RAT17745.1 D-ribose pyranase [Lonsdalea quercina]
MKKGVLLNTAISEVIARLGHTDSVVIADAGLPVAENTPRIDLALTHNVPEFMQVVAAVTAEMQVEAAILANEIVEKNPRIHDALLQHLLQLEQRQGNTISLHYFTHDDFKQQSAQSRAVIRSGECSPYANVILCAGVTF